MKRGDYPATWTTPEYIRECEARATKVSLRYFGNERWYVACLVHRYRRDDQEIQSGPVMSASSGPKDYLINDVVSVFQQYPQVSDVALLVLYGHPFLIVNIAGVWFDLISKTGKGPALISEKVVEVDNASLRS